MQELQAAEMPFNRHLKAPEEIGRWFAEKVIANCRKHDGAILLAERGEDCVGCAVLYTRVEETGEEEETPHTYALVSELVVSAEARGSGIGTALLAECEARAKAAGRDELRLAVLAANVTAYNVYKRAGYSDIKIRMAKTLT